jgi:hypothetical protein
MVALLRAGDSNYVARHIWHREIIHHASSIHRAFAHLHVYGALLCLPRFEARGAGLRTRAGSICGSFSLHDIDFVILSAAKNLLRTDRLKSHRNPQHLRNTSARLMQSAISTDARP